MANAKEELIVKLGLDVPAQGFFVFSTLEEAADALARVEKDYAHHRRAALDVARDHFAAEEVLRSCLPMPGFEKFGSL